MDARVDGETCWPWSLVDVAVLFGLLDVEGAVVARDGRGAARWARLQRFKNFRSPRCFPILAALLFDPAKVDIR
jgi:hypothetical protein